MTDPRSAGPGGRDEGASLWIVGVTLLRWRKTVAWCVAGGFVVALGLAVVRGQRYTTRATFIPETSDALGASGLALAASQFGIQLPNTSGDAWGPAVYVDIARSRDLLEPITADSIEVPELEGRRVAIIELLDIGTVRPGLQTELALRELRKVIRVSEDKNLQAVRLTATTKWPSVSLWLVNRLVKGINQFNLETRKPQAAAERTFIEGQAAGAERSLREAEDRLQAFLQRNRGPVEGSPMLVFERDRMQREVTFKQQVHSTLAQSLEEARIREVRNTPVFTLIEAPRIAAVADSRHLALKGFLGMAAGFALGMLLAGIRQRTSGAQRTSDLASQEFFDLLEQVFPRLFGRRGAR
jgi:uncharacterized protein involved in exopolysaccharide biosynthesis